MNTENKNHISLIIWIVILIAIGFAIGSSTKEEINTWYSTLNMSNLTPPNYVFPIAWTVLYAGLGASAWLIWRNPSFPNLRFIKSLYIIQLFLNWSWTPLFFNYQLTSVALIVLITMDIIVIIMIFLSYHRMKRVALLLIPYLCWILFASYLNLYIWLYN